MFIITFNLFYKYIDDLGFFPSPSFGRKVFSFETRLVNSESVIYSVMSNS